MNNTYDIGYKKPPKRTRFQKGKSGNPSGRKVRSNNAQDIISALWNDFTQVKMGGTNKKMRKREAVLWVLAQHAVKGDFKSIKKFLQLLTYEPESGGYHVEVIDECGYLDNI